MCHSHERGACALTYPPPERCGSLAHKYTAVAISKSLIDECSRSRTGQNVDYRGCDEINKLQLFDIVGQFIEVKVEHFWTLRGIKRVSHYPKGALIIALQK